MRIWTPTGGKWKLYGVPRWMAALRKAWTYSWGRLGFTKGSLSAPFTALVLRCFGSEFVVGAWELLEDGGFLLARSFLCLSMSSLCWFIHSCCLQRQRGALRSHRAAHTSAPVFHCDVSSKPFNAESGGHKKTFRPSNSPLLHEVLEGVAVSPLFCERGSVSHCSEMA